MKRKLLGAAVVALVMPVALASPASASTGDAAGCTEQFVDDVFSPPEGSVGWVESNPDPETGYDPSEPVHVTAHPDRITLWTTYEFQAVLKYVNCL